MDDLSSRVTKRVERAAVNAAVPDQDIFVPEAQAHIGVRTLY